MSQARDEERPAKCAELPSELLCGRKHALSRPQHEEGGPEQARRGEQLGSYSLRASERAETAEEG